MRNDRDTAVIEIIESHTSDVEMTGGFIKPSEVRINGQSLWAPVDQTIKVHGMEFVPDHPDDGVVKVTLTLFARRVFLGHASESPETPQRRVQDAQRRLAAAQAELAAAQQDAAG